MKTAFLVLLALAGSACIATSPDQKTRAQGFIAAWPAPASATARRFLEEYGIPEEIHANRLVWRDHGPWKRTVVYDLSPRDAPGYVGYVEQTIDYPLTQPQAEALAALGGQVVVEKGGRELTARAGSEEHDYLVLNLADEVAQGRRTAEQAQEEYRRVLTLEAAGKSSPYTQGLMFRLDAGAQTVSRHRRRPVPWPF